MEKPYRRVIKQNGKEYIYYKSKYRYDNSNGWPAPLGMEVEKRVWPTSKVEEFTNWAIRHLKIHPMEFFSASRRAEIVKMRAIISYSLMLMGASTKQIASIYRRDHTTIINHYHYTMKHFGERLDPIGSLLLDWEIYKASRH